MSRIEILETILQTLKDAPESVQQAFKDALMVHSDDQWHDLVSNDLEGLVDTENDPYIWYRIDELESNGYFDEDTLWERVWDDLEGLDRLLSKHNEMRLSKDTVTKLMKDRRTLTKDENDLIEAYLNE